jgi:hypothetical protein
MSGAITQPLAPVALGDLTNKEYTDGAYQAKQPLAVPGHLAIFGSGPDVGQTTDSGIQVDDLTIGTDTIFTSDKVMSEIRKAFYAIYQTAPVPLLINPTEVNLFINNAQIGPSTWPTLLPNDGTTFSIDGTGIVTITNPGTLEKTYRITYISGGLAETSGPEDDGAIEIRFYDENGPPVQMGNTNILTCLSTPPSPQFVNKVVNTVMVDVAPSLSFNFSVRAFNSSLPPLAFIIDPNTPTDASKLIIERIC